MATTRRNFSRAALRIERYRRSMGRTFASGMRQIGEEIMTDAKVSRPGRGVPRDTGALAGSGQVAGPRPDKSVLLSFGDQATEYALVQHERLDFHHKVGEARYLVRAVDRWTPAGSSARRALKEQAQAVARRIGAGL